MTTILVSWVLLSGLGCLALLRAAARPMPVQEDMLRSETDSTQALELGMARPQPGYADASLIPGR